MQPYTDSQEFVIYLEESREELAKTSYSTLKEKVFFRNIVRDFDNRHNLEGEFLNGFIRLLYRIGTRLQAGWPLRELGRKWG